MCVGLRYTVTSSLPSTFLVTLVSRNGIEPPSSSSVVNFMLGRMLLRTAPARPRIWKRYVDDTFTLVNLSSKTKEPAIQLRLEKKAKVSLFYSVQLA